MPEVMGKSGPDYADMTAVRAFSAAEDKKSSPDHAGMNPFLSASDMQRTAENAEMKGIRFQMART